MEASARELAAAFAAAAAGTDPAGESIALGERLADEITAVAQRYPEIDLDPIEIARYLGARSSAEGTDPGLPAHPGDVIVAWACARGDPGALALFDSEFLSRTVPVLRRLGCDPDEIDDILQEARERLLVGGPEAPPRIGSYEGSGTLVGWLRAVVGRQGLARRRRVRADVTLEDADILDSGGDPALEELKARYRDAFTAAFRDAVSALPPRDRAILKALVIDQVAVGKIAQLYRVHRVTASRWISRIREDLLAATRARLVEALDLESADIDSAIRLIRSNLEVSLASVLEARI
jgi:RNA polymerase sigma-70 factor (ECF subfamily)